MKKIRWMAGLLFSMLYFGCNAPDKEPVKKEAPIAGKKIWDQAPHNAFTDLIRYKDAFYCTFREGPSHVSGPSGAARVLKSADGENWQSVAHLTVADNDVRDPKISITPDNRLMILMDVESYKDGKVATRRPYVSFLNDAGTEFSAPKLSTVDASIASNSDWVWRVTWNKQMGYAIDYQNNGIYLLSTGDGGAFENVSKLDVDGSPNESTIRFDKNDKMYVLIRREKDDKKAVLATSNPPYHEWEYNKLDRRIGGPNFIFLNDSTLCIGGRWYPEDRGDTAKGAKTAIFLSDLKGKIFKAIELESGGDTSYPGLLLVGDELWCSYYSSHEGKTSIYLAKIPKSRLMP